MAKESVLKDKSYAFAVKIVKVYQYLTVERKEFVLSKQLLRSGTSIGANIKEALRAESKLDFIHKMNISLKEASETEYWLELLKDTDFLEERFYTSINLDCVELIKMLVASINTAKKNLSKSNA